MVDEGEHPTRRLFSPVVLSEWGGFAHLQASLCAECHFAHKSLRAVVLGKFGWCPPEERHMHFAAH